MPAQYFELKFSEADELCAAAAGWDVAFRQIDRGPLIASMEPLESAGVVYCRSADRIPIAELDLRKNTRCADHCAMFASSGRYTYQVEARETASAHRHASFR